MPVYYASYFSVWEQVSFDNASSVFLTCLILILQYSMADPSFLPALIWLALAGIIAIVLFITSYFLKSSDGKKKTPKAGDSNERVGGQRQRRGADRMRRGMHFEDNYEDDDEQDGDEFGEIPAWGEGEKIGTKKRRKLEMKAEKKAMREELENEREEKKLRQKMMEEEAKRAEKIRKKQKEKEEEEERKKKEEQERLEHEEYLRMKESFSVDNEGSGEQELEEESQSLLQEFIDYIKTTKVVLLEDLAAHFGLRTQDAINRVQVLQEVGRLTGVVDDRGKFIYISQDELEAVAKFIKQRGRVSITELSDSSNNLINLEAAIAKKKDISVQPVEASA